MAKIREVLTGGVDAALHTSGRPEVIRLAKRGVLGLVVPVAMFPWTFST